MNKIDIATSLLQTKLYTYNELKTIIITAFVFGAVVGSLIAYVVAWII